MEEKCAKCEKHEDDGRMVEESWERLYRLKLMSQLADADAAVEVAAIQYGEARGRRDLLRQIIDTLAIDTLAPDPEEATCDKS